VTLGEPHDHKQSAARADRCPLNPPSSEYQRYIRSTLSEIASSLTVNFTSRQDCFLDAANEFDESPELAILQHESGVLKVVEHYFENGIAFFTERINKAITYCCANGEIAPFVGHNAFLR